MRYLVPCFLGLICALGLAGCGGEPPEPPPPPPESVGPSTDEEKTLYALGLIMAKNVSRFGLSPAELEIVTMGLEDGVTGKEPRVELPEYGPKVQELARARAGARAQVAKGGSRGFLAQAAGEKGALKTPSGLVFRTLTPGTGANPTAEDVVRVHYRGALTDGTEFDNSRKRGKPTEFPLGGVIGCWTEGLQRMKVGETAQLVCPSEIAYGDQGRPPTIPGGATLVFEVELLAIKGE